MHEIKFTDIPDLQKKVYELATLHMSLKKESMKLMSGKGIAYEESAFGVHLEIVDDLTESQYRFLVDRILKTDDIVEDFIEKMNQRTIDEEGFEI
tara:strand:- start:606 stop:890 length:285 start_codon:yes stop_codon:yes gene_type:complete